MKIKILQIVPGLDYANGVAAYLENYYKCMKLNEFDTTILVLNDNEKGRYNNFEKLGCKIIEFFKNESWARYCNRIDEFFKNNQFDIVHCHAANYGAFFMHYAKKNNVKCRILHSHANKSADKKIREIRNNLLIPFAVKNSNYYVACSDDAGKFMFKKKFFNIFINGIDYEKYKFDKYEREAYRKKLNLNDKYVIGTFGRLCNQKNQLFTIDIFEEVLKKKENSVLLMVGDGELKNKIIKKIKDKKIENKIILLESRNDLEKMYNCLDCFLLPSTYEGLGIVLIESQMNGLKSYTSDKRVPKEAKISELLYYIDLNNNPKEWADIIVNNSFERRTKSKSINEGYNITNVSKELEKFYKKIVKVAKI